MSKRKLFLVSSIATVVLLVGMLAATAVSAQEPTPGTDTTARVRGPLGHGLLGWSGGNGWALFDAAAEALGLSPVQLFTELHSGKTLDEVAEAQSVDITMVHDAISAARADATRQAIEQAVADGTMSQQQADWMLEGLAQGFLPMGRGFGHGHGMGRPTPPEGE